VKDGVLDINAIGVEFGRVPAKFIEDVIDKFGVTRDLRERLHPGNGAERFNLLVHGEDARAAEDFGEFRLIRPDLDCLELGRSMSKRRAVEEHFEDEQFGGYGYFVVDAGVSPETALFIQVERRTAGNTTEGDGDRTFAS
jgi:hypothetical protein